MSRTLAVALILVLAGCGRSDSSDTSQTTATVEATQTTTETTQTIMSNALACLEEAGLSNVEERDVGLWGGLHHGPSYAIVVHKLAETGEGAEGRRRGIRGHGIVQGRRRRQGSNRRRGDPG